MFYFSDALEGEWALELARSNDVPHRLRRFRETAYGGAVSLGRGWGQLYIPEPELDRFMALTQNRLAPEPEPHVDAQPQVNNGCLGRFWMLKHRRTSRDG